MIQSNSSIVSVLMPIYNTSSKHLREAIESILNQTYTNFEFIILNDSPDNKELKDIVLGYQDERIRYFENTETIGIARSYNRLIDLANTDIIAIMNHDDCSLSNRLEVQYEYLINHPEVGIVGSAYKKFGEINRFRNIHPVVDDEEIKAYLLFKSSIHHPTVMMRKKVLDENNIRYNENYISLNDRQLYYDLGKHTKLANIDKILYKYRFHKNMTSKCKKSVIFAEQCDFHSYWFKDNGVELNSVEKTFFDCFGSIGRSKIKEKETLLMVKNVLEKIALEVRDSKNVDYESFSKVCGEYLVKRLVNAGIWGQINSFDIQETTSLPIVKDIRLKIVNSLLKWKK